VSKGPVWVANGTTGWYGRFLNLLWRRRPGSGITFRVTVVSSFQIRTTAFVIRITLARGTRMGVLAPRSGSNLPPLGLARTERPACQPGSRFTAALGLRRGDAAFAIFEDQRKAACG